MKDQLKTNFLKYLMRQDLLTEEQKTRVEKMFQEDEADLDRIIIRNNILKKDDYYQILAGYLSEEMSRDIMFYPLSPERLDEEIVRLIPESMARRHVIIPVGKENGRLKLAMADPSDLFATDDVAFRTGYEIEPVLGARDDILSSLAYVFGGMDESWDEVIGDLKGDLLQDIEEIEDQDVDLAEASKLAQEAPVLRLVNNIILQALKRKASDIHIEPLDRQSIVRYRVDGVLYEEMTLPLQVHAPVVSRIKIMASMDIANRRTPQDGKARVKFSSREIDLRISVVPSVRGEGVVVRILDVGAAMLSLEELGFLSRIRERFEREITKPNGIILVTGPTGSGKSTTLYSVLNKVNSPDRKIITIEDPVEYQLEGLVQVQTNPKAELTFASGLRSFLRHDPDIILVGEIRDTETAKIAVEAAMTGHLVFSTLHTNSAIGAISRLFEMGIEPFLLGASLNTVLAQRLVRRIHEDCKVDYMPTESEQAELERYGLKLEGPLKHGKGCDGCMETGYKGRTGIHELFVVSKETRELIGKGVTDDQIEAQTQQEGMQFLREDGLRKVLRGITTLEEIYRVTVEA